MNFYANDTKMTAISSTTGTESTNGAAYFELSGRELHRDAAGAARRLAPWSIRPRGLIRDRKLTLGGGLTVLHTDANHLRIERREHDAETAAAYVAALDEHRLRFPAHMGLDPDRLSRSSIELHEQAGLPAANQRTELSAIQLAGRQNQAYPQDARQPHTLKTLV